jgi:hypothetical protein
MEHSKPCKERAPHRGKPPFFPIPFAHVIFYLTRRRGIFTMPFSRKGFSAGRRFHLMGLKPFVFRGEDPLALHP